MRRRPELDPADPVDAAILAGLHAVCAPTPVEGCLAAVELHDGVVVVRGVLAGEPHVPGAVGRWLDLLPRGRPVLVAAVVSGRLAGMLERRGFRPHLWMDPGIGFDNAAMYRPAEPR
jgi:hypothetical protein